MAQHNYPIDASDGKIYWDGYNQGVFGLSRRNLFTGRQAEVYDQGYDEGLEVFKETAVKCDPTTKVNNRETINQVLAMRNEIEKHEAEIRRLKDTIKKLEAN